MDVGLGGGSAGQRGVDALLRDRRIDAGGLQGGLALDQQGLEALFEGIGRGAEAFALVQRQILQRLEELGELALAPEQADADGFKVFEGVGGADGLGRGGFYRLKALFPIFRDMGSFFRVPLLSFMRGGPG